MMFQAKVAEKLQQCVNRRLLTETPMSQYTSWRIGGPADYLAIPDNETELSALLVCCKNEAIPWFVIGKGSNLLVADTGIAGLVIQISDAFSWCNLLPDYRVSLGAGLALASLAQTAAKAGYGGLEWAAGIPGSVGGAIIMNAGAYGSCIGSFVTKIHLVEYTGQRRALTSDSLAFAYRQSGIDKTKQIVTGVELQLQAGDAGASCQEIRRLLALRAKNQPLDLPSAGSVFKNPPGDHAGRLSEAAGCKGMRVGDAQVSLKHGNFIVNLGHATARDVLALMTQVQEKVAKDFGVMLQPEVQVVGE